MTTNNSVTMLAVVRLPDASTRGVFIKNGYSDGFGFGVGNGGCDSPGNEAVGVFDQISWLPSGTHWGTGALLAEMTLDPVGRPVLYRNGAFLANIGSGGPVAATGPTFIGGYNYASARYFRGDIAEVLIFNRLLTDAERQAWESYLNAKYQYDPPPPAPSQVEAGALSATQIAVSWADAFQNISGYRIERQNADGTWSVLATVGPGVTQYVDGGLAAGSQYHYRVTALNSSGNSPTITVSGSTAVSSAGAFPTAGMALWLRADSGVTVDTNNLVSAWADQSGNGHHVGQGSAGNQPTLIASAYNGQPALRFNGGSAYLQTATAFDLLAGSDDCSVFVVTRPGASQPTYANLFDYSHNSVGFEYEQNGNNLNQFYCNGFAQVQLQAGQLCISSLIKGGTSHQVFYNGQLASGGAAPASLNMAPPRSFLVGNWIGGGRCYNGDIAELLIFNRALTDAETQTVEIYLNDKYAVVTPPPTPTSLGATAISASQANLFWSAAPAATGYSVERKDAAAPDSAYTAVGSIAGGEVQAYIDSALNPGAGYTYRLRAYNLAGYSGYSAAGIVILPATAADSAGPLPTDDLCLWLKPDAGVTRGSEGLVSAWTDASGRGGDAFAPAGNRPQWVDAAVNGQPTLRFDGSTSYLQLPGGFSDFTRGFTALVVAKPTAAASYARFFDLGNGAARENILLGRLSTTDGMQFYCQNSYFALFPSSGLEENKYQLVECWQDPVTQTASVYKNGAVLATGGAGSIVNTTRASNFIGRSNWGDPLFQGDIAEVVFFDHALTDAERQRWELYLNTKYQYDPPPPAAQQLTVDPLSSTQAALSWTENFDNVATFLIERRNPDGSWTIVATVDGHSRGFVDSGLVAGQSYAYRITATNAVGSSPVSAVASTTTDTFGTPLPTANLRLWLKADAGVSASSVGAWLDQSGRHNDAQQGNGGAQPTLISNALNGRPAVHFDPGHSLALPSVTMAGKTAGEMFIVTRSTAAGASNGFVRFGSQGYGEAYFPLSDGRIADSFGSTTDWDTGPTAVNLGQFHLYDAASTSAEWTNRLDGVTHFTTSVSKSTNTVGFTSAPSLGGTWVGFQGDIAEIFVFDRALSADEREALGRYINARYGLVAVPGAPAGVTAAVVSASQTSLTWNPVAGTGSVVYTIERKVAGGTADFAAVAQVADATSFLDAGLAANTSYVYRIRVRNYAGQSNYSTQVSVTTPAMGAGADALPLDGLRLWLKADAGVSGNNVGLWLDQSSRHNNAHQENGGAQPTLVNVAINARPAVHFDGNDVLSLPPGMMDGAIAGEMFVVTRSTAAGANNGFVRFGSQYYGEAYFPLPDGRIADSFGSTTDWDTGTTTANLGDFHLYNAASTSSEWTNRIDGALHFTTLANGAVNTVGFTGTPNLGETWVGFQGDIAEILVFDHALSDSERQAVGHYLNGRYLLVPVPEQPVALTAKALSASQAGLGWVFATSGGAPLGYSVERKIAGGSFQEVASVSGAQAGAFINENLTANTTYTYRVRAYNLAGYSDYSPETTVTPAQAVASPANLPGITDLQLWLRSDAGVAMDAASQLVSGWTDASGHGNNAFAVSGSQPRWIDNALNGQPVLRFDGSTSSLRLPAGFRDFTRGLTALVVTHPTHRASSQTFLDLGNGAGLDNLSLLRNSTGNDLLYNAYNGRSVATQLNAPGAIVLDDTQLFELVHGTSGTVTMYKDGAQIAQGVASSINNVIRTSNYLGADNAADPLFQGDIAEVLLFDRALTDDERKAWELYLNARYNYRPVPPAPVQVAASPLSYTQAILSWVDTFQDIDAYRVECQNPDGTWSVVATLGAGSTSYVLDGLTAGATAALRVIATNATGDSLAATVSLDMSATGVGLPLADMILWLRADSGTIGGADGHVSRWLDRSGHGNDAQQPVAGNQPTTIPSVLNSHPAVRFDGENAFLQFPSGLFDGVSATEVFVVVRASDPLGGDRGLWRFTDRGDSLYPSNDHLVESFGTQSGYTLNVPPAPLDQFNLYNVSAAADAWTARLNWKTVLASTSNTVDLSAGAYLLGQTRGGQRFAGDMAEVLVFRHALSNDERLSVEQYLNGKYALVSALPFPSALSAQALSPTRIGLTWQYSGTADAGTHFTIERAIAGTSNYEVIAVLGNVSSFIDATAVAGAAYNYKVFATSAAGDVSASTAPAQATALTAAPGPGDLVTNYEPDELGRVKTQTVDPQGQNLVTRYTYDLNNNKTSVTDPRLQTTTFVYDARNRLQEVDYPAVSGQTTAPNRIFTYDANGNKLSETDENHHPVRYEYDAFNRLVTTTRVMDPGPDLVTRYTYNAVGSRIGITDPRVQSTTTDYDALQRPVRVTDAMGGQTTYAYGVNSGGSIFESSSFKPTLVTDPRGHTEATDYDALYRPTQVTRSAGVSPGSAPFAVTRFEYDNVGNATASTDPVGNATNTIYDALNRPVRVDYADGTQTQAFYTPTGLKWKTLDELQQATEMVYDGAGRLTQTYGPPPDAVNAPAVRPLTQVFYDGDGNVAATIDPRGNRCDYAFDARNRKTDEYQPAVADYDSGVAARPHLHWDYDDVGNVTSTSNARENQAETTPTSTNRTETVYDWVNRPLQVKAPAVPAIQPDGSALWVQPTTVTTYDPNGNVLTVLDANLHLTTNTYDALNRLWTTTNAEQIKVTYGYDAVGNRTSVQVDDLPPTGFGYDGLKRNTSITDAAGKATIFTYDGLNKVARTDALVQVTHYDYDARNRLRHARYDTSSKEDRTYAYDSAGRLLSVTDAGDHSALSAVAYTYDGLGRVLTETSNQATHTYGYDLGGNRTSVQYGLVGGGSGRAIASTYDALNRLDTLTEGGANTTTYHYDLDGHVRGKDLPSGEKEVTTFDALGRQSDSSDTTAAGALLYAYNYGRDAAGNLRLMSEYKPGLPAATRTTTMAYDQADRLTQEAVYSGTDTSATATPVSRTGYGYDASGNRTSKSVADGVTTTYSVNALNELTGFTESGGRSVSFTYDDNGNRATRTEGTATDAYAYDTENRLISLDKAGTHYTYLYDYRTRRVIRTESGASTQVVFSGGTSVQEYSGSDAGANTPSVEFIRGSDWGGGVGGILYSVRGGSASFDHFDGRGDVTTQTNPSGTVTYQAEYEAYGTRVQEFGSDADRQRANTKEEDPSGLLNEGMRYRDLETGSFITRDPAGMVDGPNLYGYVRANPWTKFDPEGLEERAVNGQVMSSTEQHRIPVSVMKENNLHPEVAKALDENASINHVSSRSCWSP